MRKVIITGAGGFIGSSLAKKFAENGISVVAISREYNSNFPNNSNIERISTQISTMDGLRRLIPEGEYDAFYHLAWRGVNGIEKSDSDIQADNIRVTLDCARVAKDMKCGKFLCSGTIAEKSVESLRGIKKSSGGMTYGIAKYCAHLMVENYCKYTGLDFVWMQFANIYGPGNRTGNLVDYTIGQLDSGKDAVFGSALQPYDFIYIDDVIEAAYRLGVNKTNSDFYFIGSGKPRILKNYLEEIGEICGKPDLIKIGIREDDGILYTMDMFDTSDIIHDIGEFALTNFTDGIKLTLKG